MLKYMKKNSKYKYIYLFDLLISNCLIEKIININLNIFSINTTISEKCLISDGNGKKKYLKIIKDISYKLFTSKS